ncbi:MAG: hypothetical protein UHI81_09285 [Olegusella sp.]|nr:hypothetical protein [Olegusella sp.]
MGEDGMARAVREIDADLGSWLPEGVGMYCYSYHEGMLPYSPTTLKKDRNGMAAQRDGYVALG